MERMSCNDKSTSRYFRDSSIFANCILDSGSMCHITPHVSGFIPVSLDDTDTYIEVADGHYVTAKQKVQVQIKMCNDNGDTFITTLHNIILSPDLGDRLFSIITLMNLGHTYSFHKWFCTVYFGKKEK